MADKKDKDKDANKTSSEIYLNATNRYLLIAGVALVVVFIFVVIISFTSKKQTTSGLVEELSAAERDLAGIEEDVITGQQYGDKVAKFKITPVPLLLSDVVINTQATIDNVTVEVADIPVRIQEVKALSSSISIDKNTCNKKVLTPGEKCSFRVVWSPKDYAMLESVIVINYKDETKRFGREGVFTERIPLVFKVKQEEKVVPQPVDNVSVPAESGVIVPVFLMPSGTKTLVRLSEDREVKDSRGNLFGLRGEYENEGFIMDMNGANRIASFTRLEAPKNICETSGTRAVDSQGVRIWIMSNNDIFDNRCNQKIGELQPDGTMISTMADSNGKIMGYAQNIAQDVNITLPKIDGTPDEIAGVDADEAKRLADAIAISERRLAAMRPREAPADDKSTGLYTDGADRWRSPGIDKMLEKTKRNELNILSRFKMIPATFERNVIIGSINGAGVATSNLPVIAQVERNVYGPYKNLLVPAGSKLYGNLQNTSTEGDESSTLFKISGSSIAWEQLVLTDGRVCEFSTQKIDPNKIATGDAIGRPTIPGKTSETFLTKYVNPILQAVVPTALMYAFKTDGTTQIDRDPTGGTSTTMTGDQVLEQAKNEMYNKLKEMLQNDIFKDKAAVSTIAAGTRVTVMLNNDLDISKCTRLGEDDPRYSLYAQDRATVPVVGAAPGIPQNTLPLGY